MDVSELKQIVDIFIHEADEALSQFEHCFLALEREGPSDVLLDKIFRTAHNLKGSSAALGFSELAEFTHHFESFLLALKKKEVPVTAQVVSLLLGSRDFISEHIESLRAGRKSPGKGDPLVQAMAREKEPKPVAQVIELPRPPEAGDIWFVGEDLKAELFELPEPPAKAVEPEVAPIDPKMLAIHAEIFRLTQLAAAVNLTTVQTASALAETASDIPSQQQEWSLAGVQKILDAEPKNDITAIPNELAATSQPPSDTEAIETNTKNASPDKESGTDFSQQTQNISQSESKDSASALAALAHQATPIEAIAANTVQLAPMQTPSDESVRVNLARIDKLLNYVGELVILQSVLDEHRAVFTSPLLQKSVAQMSKIIREVQELSMGLRMVKLKPVFLKLQRIVRDTSKALNKDVHATYIGDETEIDKTVLDKIGDPLVHLVRNALDHGLETTEERLATGKPAQGQITINAFQQSRAIVIEVKDDGRGLDSGRIREKAIERGLMTAFDQFSEEKIRSFIFHPGFSTKAVVTDLSGRGVGLDVVSSNVQSMQGRIEIESAVGEGTTFRILLPLTVAVVDGFIVKLGEERYIVPKSQVAETLRPQEVDVNLVQGRSQLLNLRGMTVPLFHLATLLQKQSHVVEAKTTFDGIALVVMENSKNPFAVIVDDVLSQQQVVIKKLGRELQGLAGLSGAAILGDGRPAVILDLAELIEAQRKGSLGRPNGKVA